MIASSRHHPATVLISTHLLLLHKVIGSDGLLACHAVTIVREGGLSKCQRPHIEPAAVHPAAWGMMSKSPNKVLKVLRFLYVFTSPDTHHSWILLIRTSHPLGIRLFLLDNFLPLISTYTLAFHPPLSCYSCSFF